MSTSAHERRCYLSNNAARDIANSLFQKWAVKGFFPAGERSEPRSRTAPEGSLPTERGQTVPALRPELDAPNKFGASNRSAPADRSPRRIAGRAARVAVPRAFFGTFFRFERKYCPPRGGSPTARAGVGASFPQLGFPYGRVVLRSSFRPLPPSGHPGSRLSHRDRDDASTNALDTFLRVIIGTAHTAVRSACCLPSFF